MFAIMVNNQLHFMKQSKCP